MNIILLILIIINIIYNLSGLFYVLTFIIWGINLTISTYMLIQDPNNIWLRTAQGTSILVVLYIIFLNINLLMLKIFL